LASIDSLPDGLIKCPYCGIGHLIKSEQKTKLGTNAIEKLICDNNCPTVFLQVKDKFKLIEGVKSSDFWHHYKEVSLTIEQWGAFNQGAPVHYDPKIGTYVPYVPDKYSEPKPIFNSFPANTSQLSRSLPEQTVSATINEVSASPVEIPVGAAVTVTVNISNNENDPGIFTIPLFINDEFRENKTVTLFGKSSTIVTFNVIESIPGTYTISVAGDLTHIVRFVVQSEIYNNDEQFNNKDSSEINNCDEDSGDLSENEDSSEDAEGLSENYYLSKAGKTFLKKPLEDILETYHLLRCFDEGIELEPEEYDYLIKKGLLKEKDD